MKAFFVLLLLASGSVYAVENLPAPAQFVAGQYTLEEGSDTRNCPEAANAEYLARGAHGRSQILLNGKFSIPVVRGDEKFSDDIWPGQDCVEHVEYNETSDDDSSTITIGKTEECANSPSVLTGKETWTISSDKISLSLTKPYEEKMRHKRAGSLTLNCSYRRAN